jgi:hypothetical protein
MLEIKFWVNRINQLPVEQKLRIYLGLGLLPFFFYWFCYLFFRVYWPLFELMSFAIGSFSFFVIGLFMIINKRNPITSGQTLFAYPVGAILTIGGFYYLLDNILGIFAYFK